MNIQSTVDMATALGAKRTESLINWIWSYGFPSRENAEKFLKFIEEHGGDHRGIYKGEANTFDIRWRF